MKKYYSTLPESLRNVAITAYNAMVLYRKYGYVPFINSLDKIQRQIKKQRRVFNIPKHLLVEEFNRFIDYISVKVPYYRARKNEYKLIKKLEDIKNLPILPKSVFRKHISEFYSEDINKFNTSSFHTSGTTGTPITGYVSVKDLRKRYLILLSAMINNGFDITKPYARIIGHDIGSFTKVYRRDLNNPHFFLSAFHLSDKTIKQYFDAVSDNKIETLEGYPSVISTMAALFKKHDLHPEHVKQIYTTAEKLHEHQKEMIESVFNCPVYDYYGSNEQSVLIYTCPQGKMHLSNLTGILEVLDENGNQVKPGQSGEMVVTSFTSSFTPIVRYKIGDRCMLAQEQNCSCGGGGIIIDEILGRDEEIFKTVDNVYITRFSVVLKTLPSRVVQSQLILSNSKLEARLRYIADFDLLENEVVEYTKKLENKIGSNYKITFERVESLMKNNKVKVPAVKIDE